MLLEQDEFISNDTKMYEFCIWRISSLSWGAIVVVIVQLQLPMQPVSITTNVVSSNVAYGVVYSIQYYAMNFVSDLWQSGCFFPKNSGFPPLIKLTATT